MALAVAVQHHTGVSNRINGAELLTPPSEARMAVLVQEELTRRHKALRKQLARRGMSMADLGERTLDTNPARLRW